MVHLQVFPVAGGSPMKYLLVNVPCVLQLLGGYLYFHKAPNAQEFFEETRDKVRERRYLTRSRRRLS